MIAAVLLAALAASTRADVGAAGGLMLTEPPAARPASLGEAYAAEGGRSDALGYNPAGLAALEGTELAGLYHAGFSGDTLLSAQGAFRIPFGALAVGAAHYNAGSVEKLLVNGDLVEISGERDVVAQAGAGFALPFAGLSVGAAAEVLHSQLVEEIEGTAGAGSLGVRWELPARGLAFGAAVQHLGGPLTLASDKVALPRTARAGASYRLTLPAFGGLPSLATAGSGEAGGDPHAFLLLAELVQRTVERQTTYAGGAEYEYAGVLAVRGGVRQLARGTAAAQHVFGAGAGVRALGMRLDYAIEFLPFTALHRIGLTIAPRGE